MSIGVILCLNDIKDTMDTYRRLLFLYIGNDNETQRATAERLGIAEGTLSRWLSGSIEISSEYYARIRQIVGINLSELNCPLSGGHCPVFDGTKINHVAAEIFHTISNLDSNNQHKLLSYLQRLSKKE